MTVNFHGGLSIDVGHTLFSSWDFADEEKVYTPLRGTIGADLRFYYNLQSRIDRGKSIRRNSGNFLSVDLMYNTPSFGYDKQRIHNKSNTIAYLNYGLRRVYRRGWLIEWRMGYAVGYDWSAKGSKWGGKPKFEFKVGYSF